ncbi:unnamed protein product [Mytilus coruscus]|uniref:Uncharacterized protein n=1 Tax=Mytilus coruscus TaxID=42192 RepID=A0A6J8CUJ5_MYTCO|nr:unnamed protein product [Mytilus coruscus]
MADLGEKYKDLLETLEAMHVEPKANTPEEFAAWMQSYLQQQGKQADIKPNVTEPQPKTSIPYVHPPRVNTFQEMIRQCSGELGCSKFLGAQGYSDTSGYTGAPGFNNPSGYSDARGRQPYRGGYRGNNRGYRGYNRGFQPRYNNQNFNPNTNYNKDTPIICRRCKMPNHIARFCRATHDKDGNLLNRY